MFPPQHFQGQLILIYCNHASLPSIILLVFPGRTHLLIIQILSACLDIYRTCVCMCECVCLVTQSCLTFCNPIPARLLCLWGFSRQECYSGLSCPPSGDLLNPGIKPWSPIFQADYLPAEPQEKPNNTGVGSLSLLQGTFPTQKSNQGLLHCRWILYQLSYQGSPYIYLYTYIHTYIHIYIYTHIHTHI